MSLKEIFNKATTHLQFVASELNPTELLKFYALYKQATVGSCNAQRPSWYQVQARQKWEAWKNLNDMSREAAMVNYVEELSKIRPDWEEDSKSDSRGWVAVSSMRNTEEEVDDTEKTFLDWIKEGNEVKVRELLDEEPRFASLVDSEGLFPIHWAADRGHLTIIQHLIKKGANVNSQDADGQTALHYAASCGHLDVAKYLISIGAEAIEDNDGKKPKDVADEHLIAIF